MYLSLRHVSLKSLFHFATFTNKAFTNKLNSVHQNWQTKISFTYKFIFLPFDAFLVITFIIFLFEQSKNKFNYKPTFEEFDIYMYCLINKTAKYFHNIGLYINTSKTEYYSFEKKLKTSKAIAKTSVFIDEF